MSKLIGLITATGLLLATFNLTPWIQLPWHWQVVACIALGVINLVVWEKEKPPAISLKTAAIVAIQYFALVAAIGIFDTMLGFLFGAQSVPEAFIHSGPLGGVVDAFLFIYSVFVGIPTLAKSVYEFRLAPEVQ